MSLEQDILKIAQLSLQEDIGHLDVSAALIDKNIVAKGELIAKENCLFCGKIWIDAFQQLSQSPLEISYYCKDGDSLKKGQKILSISGYLKQILTIERSLLNGLQILCSTATQTHQFVRLIEDLPCQILDTRKTLPGWRLAQKYAVKVGGGKNHRLGLYDAFMLKENHLMSEKSISQLIIEAKHFKPHLPIIVEVETLEQLQEALQNNPQQILLDNFTIGQLKEAVKQKETSKSNCQLEASGGVRLNNIREIAETGVDYISIGKITKDIKAIDLSFLII